jgi:hypothetical protein
MDDLDALLTPAPPPPEPAGLRDAAWRPAARVLRRRRGLRAGRWVLVLAVVYVAGAATVWLWRPDRPAPAPPPPAQQPEELPPADPYRADPPERIEQWAGRAGGAARVALYRRAGDGYLARGDEAKALRCYKQCLDGGRPEDLAIRADQDSWLLMSLKLARQREKPDARN